MAVARKTIGTQFITTTLVATLTGHIPPQLVALAMAQAEEVEPAAPATKSL